MPSQRKIPDVFEQLPKLPSWKDVNGDYDLNHVDDFHPIHNQIIHQDDRWDSYQAKGKAISQNFTTVVKNYRLVHKRNPPPGFDKWYKFARERKVEILGDFNGEAHGFVGPFQQIMDDMRPFWGVEPKVIRLLAGRMHENMIEGIAGVHIRGGAVSRLNEGPIEWRADTFCQMIQSFVKDLPDMDIAINKLNKPRVTVPWDELQKLLATEVKSRGEQQHTLNEWTKGMTGFWEDDAPKDPVEDPGFSDQSGQPYMSIVKGACPPESKVRSNNITAFQAQFPELTRSKNTIVQNHNRSLDLCRLGPHISSLHSMLHSPSELLNTARLIPIFSEGKTNVNNDILYPSPLYWDASDDGDYSYDGKYDYTWDDKHDTMYWRGTTTALQKDDQKWKDMQRDRLVDKLNATATADKNVTVIGTDPLKPEFYGRLLDFEPAKYAAEHADAKFVRGGNCGRNCSALESSWDLQNTTTLAEQFQHKYLVDVDGDGFSPRFRALLQSRSLPIKSTIFKEWHSSRLFAWVHYVPLDVEYRELYSLLTYFVGYGNAEGNEGGEDYVNTDVYVQRHDFEGRRMAKRGAEWAQKVLRAEDIEVCLFSLFLLSASFRGLP